MRRVLGPVSLAVLCAAPSVTWAPRWLGSDAAAPATRARPVLVATDAGAVAVWWSPLSPPRPSATAVPGTVSGPVPDPAPAPEPVAPPDPGGAPAGRVSSAFESSVPAAWRDVVPVRLSLRPGSQSRAYTDGAVEIGWSHATGDWERLRAVVAHEFGHQVAFRLGTGAYLGAAPSGWASSGPVPAERWADCVALVLTGVALGSVGLPPCDGESLATAAAILATPPATSSS